MSNEVEWSYSSPLGQMRLVANEDSLIEVHFTDSRGVAEPLGRAPIGHAVIEAACARLDAYFANGDELADVPFTLGLRGTCFQQEVWAALRSIRFGEVTTYGELATKLGRTGAARAVGAANARNPLALFIPCHRVIGRSERGTLKLTGYAGGLDRKARLLAHERIECLTVGFEPNRCS